METRDAVRQFYGNVATTEGASCCAPGCCAKPADSASLEVGYTAEQLAAIPEQANLGLGCGNPIAIAELSRGEVVVDLGSGAGIDVFLAAQAVGDEGRVIGVDMTQEMLSRARETAAQQWPNVEFRLGEIENLPIGDNAVDVVISNCVVNLSPDKPRVYEEVYRVLRPGGRVRISDVLALQPLPEALRNDLTTLAACIGGAATVDDTTAILRDAGFVDIEVETKADAAKMVEGWMPGASEYVASATIRATKPR